jgi:hypothetical protein
MTVEEAAILKGQVDAIRSKARGKSNLRPGEFNVEV